MSQGVRTVSGGRGAPIDLADKSGTGGRLPAGDMMAVTGEVSELDALRARVAELERDSERMRGYLAAVGQLVAVAQRHGLVDGEHGLPTLVAEVDIREDR